MILFTLNSITCKLINGDTTEISVLWGQYGRQDFKGA